MKLSGFIGPFCVASVALSVHVAYELVSFQSKKSGTWRSTVGMLAADPADGLVHKDPAGVSQQVADPVDGEDEGNAGNGVARRILALYDSTERADPDESEARSEADFVTAGRSAIQRFARLPLNHLGLVVDYFNVAQGVPEPGATDGYRGILTWFKDDKMVGAGNYLSWLQQEIRSGRRVVVLDRLGALENMQGSPISDEEVAQTFAALGARYGGHYQEERATRPTFVSTGKRVPIATDIMRPARGYYELHANAGTRVHVRLPQAGGTRGTDMVWTSRSGGFAAESSTLRFDTIGGATVPRWVLDPVAFFGEAFDVRALPAPDFTTLNGRRIAVAEIIDLGFGWTRVGDTPTPTAEVIAGSLLKRYDLLFTVGVRAEAVAPPPMGTGSTQAVRVAREIFALPNVEIAVVGGRNAVSSTPVGEKSTLRKPLVAKPESQALGAFTATGEPRAGLGIARSIEYVNTVLARPPKSCRVALWPQRTILAEDDLKRVANLGLASVGGAVSRLDAMFPSMASLAPPSRLVGATAMVQSTAPSDRQLTRDGSFPYYQYLGVLQTFVGSGAPRRLLPMHLRFSHVSVLRHPSLKALHQVLEWVIARRPASISASDYANTVRDFENARIARSRSDTWEIRKGPALRTLRFAGRRFVDFKRSKGVLGYRFDADVQATYVHLDGSHSAVIRATRRKRTRPRQPYLLHANQWVDDMSRTSKGVTLHLRGALPHDFAIAGLRPGSRYCLERVGDRPSSREQCAVASSDGEASFSTAPGDVEARIHRRGSPS